MEDLAFIVPNKKGEKIIYHAIATSKDEKTNKDYIIYTDNTKDENGKLKVYYSLYTFVNKKLKLIEIDNAEDEKYALKLLKEVIADLK